LEARAPGTRQVRDQAPGEPRRALPRLGRGRWSAAASLTISSSALSRLRGITGRPTWVATMRSWSSQADPARRRSSACSLRRRARARMVSPSSGMTRRERWFLASVHTAPRRTATSPSSMRSVSLVASRSSHLSARASERRRPYSTPRRKATAQRWSALAARNEATCSVQASTARCFGAWQPSAASALGRRGFDATNLPPPHRPTPLAGRCDRSGSIATTAGRRRPSLRASALCRLARDGPVGSYPTLTRCAGAPRRTARARST
jgi:hypothetical protein